MAARTDQKNAGYSFIETTMIGDSTFDQALTRALQEFDEALPHLDAKEVGHGWVPSGMPVKRAFCRSLGILIRARLVEILGGYSAKV